MKHFSQNILAWYSINKRDFPWRKSVNVYHTWICEIMSQQTTLAVVLPRFQKFISTLPDVTSLANCDEEILRRLWAGLGYYARARNLKKGAQYIVESLNTQFPKTKDAWLKVPGCGDYTSSIIASICFNEKTPSIDGNVIRVVSRILSLKEEAWERTGKEKIACYLNECLAIPKTTFHVGDFNQAMMDLGATVCKKQNPSCNICPVNNYCSAFKNNLVHLCPSIKPKKKFTSIEIFTLVFTRKSNTEVALTNRTHGFLSQTKGFPILNWNEKILKKIKSLGIQHHYFEKSFQHTITHHKMTAHTLFFPNIENQFQVKNILEILALDSNFTFVPFNQLKLNLSSSLDHKVLKTLFSNETIVKLN